MKIPLYYLNVRAASCEWSGHCIEGGLTPVPVIFLSVSRSLQIVDAYGIGQKAGAHSHHPFSNKWCLFKLFTPPYGFFFAACAAQEGRKKDTKKKNNAHYIIIQWRSWTVVHKCKTDKDTRNERLVFIASDLDGQKQQITNEYKIDDGLKLTSMRFRCGHFLRK